MNFRTALFLLLILVMMAACQPAQDEIVIPTLAVLPTITGEAATAQAVVDAEVTEDTEPVTPSDTPTRPPTRVPTATFTPGPTNTPRPTNTTDPTEFAIQTATSAAVEAPVFATLTPVTPDTSPNRQPTQVAAVPQVAADIVITEQQFQEELDRLLADQDEIERAIINFLPGQFEILLTAPGGDALMTGTIYFDVQFEGDAASFALEEIVVNAPEIPDDYQSVVYGDLLLLMVNTFSAIRTQRVGDDSQIGALVVTDDDIQITLLVPED